MRRIAWALALSVMIASCSSSSESATTPGENVLTTTTTTAAPTTTTTEAPVQTLTGSMTLREVNSLVMGNLGGSCSGDGGYDDMRGGAQVVVRNAEGVPIATGQLAPGKWVQLFEDVELLYCRLPFRLEVPNDEAFYLVEVGSRGELTYSADDMEERGWHLELELG